MYGLFGAIVAAFYAFLLICTGIVLVQLIIVLAGVIHHVW